MRKVLSGFIAVCLVLSLFTGVFAAVPSARAFSEGGFTYSVVGTAPNHIVRTSEAEPSCLNDHIDELQAPANSSTYLDGLDYQTPDPSRHYASSGEFSQASLTIAWINPDAGSDYDPTTPGVQILVSSNFVVKIRLTNNDPNTDLTGVEATLHWGTSPTADDHVGTELSDGSAQRSLGTLAAGTMAETAWNMHCTSPVNVHFWVTVEAQDPAVSLEDHYSCDGVDYVEQLPEARISCEILSPSVNSTYATGTMFAVTGTFTNTSNFPAFNVWVGVFFGQDWNGLNESPAAEVTSTSPNPEHVSLGSMAPGASSTLMWTMRAIRPTPSGSDEQLTIYYKGDNSYLDYRLGAERDPYYISGLPVTYVLVATASPTLGGSVVKSPDATSYALGAVVTLTATPASGYTFSNWTGATPVSGHPDQATATMNADKTVTAAFTINTGDFQYTVAGGNAMITKYTGSGGAVVIPDTLGGHPVTSIGANAFYQCTALTSVTIPNSVISVGYRGFSGCSGLTSLTIGSGVTSISNYAFSGCSSLTSITIPSSVTSIGDGAFGWCSSLPGFIVDPGNPSYSSSADGVLFNKTATLLIQYPGGKQGSYVIPSSATSIGDYAFNGCSSLTNVTISNSVTSIGEIAFYFCPSLTSVSIGSGVTSIGDGAFADCPSLTIFIVDPGNPSYSSSADGVLFNKTATLLIQYPGGKQGSYVIPNSVTGIGYEAFWVCWKLTSVTIPGSVTSIGDSAFGHCSSLTVAYFLGNAPTIGDNVFASCAPGFTIYYLSSTTGWTNPWHTYPTATFVAALVLSASWNLVSVSVSLPVSSIPGLQAVYGYHDGWSVPVTLAPGEAYWVQVQNAVTVPLPGTPSVLPVSIAYQGGWQLLGNPFDVPLPVSSITNHALITTCYSYGPNWGSVDLTTGVLEPGKGYWIQLSTSTTLILIHP